MPYTEQQWADGVITAPYGPISGPRLQHIEDGLAAVANGGSLPVNVKTDYGAKGDGSTDDTAAIQAAINAVQAAGAGIIFFPAGTYIVTNLTLSYSAISAQPSSGAPYGYPGLILQGTRRGSVIQQKTGTAGVVLSCNGKTGTSAGAANNNKLSGLTIRDLEIVGNASGSHGLQLESVVDCSVEDVVLRGCGGSGFFLARNYFNPGTNDEYAYAIRLSNVRAIANTSYGFQMGYPDAVSYAADNCDAEDNTAGGWYICGANPVHTGCYAIGNGGSGYWTVNSNQSPGAPQAVSTTAGITWVGCRSEANGGTYEFQLDGGTAPTLLGCSVYATAGAHCIGFGTAASGVFLRRLCVTGGYFSGNGSTSGQKFLVTGTDGQNAQLNGVRIEYSTFAGGNTFPNQLITDSSGQTSLLDNQNIIFNPAGWIDFVREISTPGAAPAGEVRVYAKNDGASHGQLAVRFPTGGEQILAYEGVPISLTQSVREYLLNGSSAGYRESLERSVASTAQTITTGVLYIVALPLFVGDVVTTLHFFASTALTRGTTPGTAHLWAALFDPSLNLLSQSTDQGDSSALANFGPFTLAAAQTIATSGVYYAGIMCVAGSGGSPVQPALRCGSTGNNAFAGGTGTQKVLAATDSGSYTTTAPSTTTVATPLSAIPYVLSEP